MLFWRFDTFSTFPPWGDDKIIFYYQASGMHPLCARHSITIFPPHYFASISVHISASSDDFLSQSSKYEDIRIQDQAAVATVSPDILQS